MNGLAIDTTDPSMPTIMTPSETTIRVSRARVRSVPSESTSGSATSPSRSPTNAMKLKLPVATAAATCRMVPFPWGKQHIARVRL